ncbi:MAG: hypothetical protein JJ934_12455 [Pseudomonadales bacterium]|nr:hypothetical protein [Pseudomonadales bacterium]MBO6703641.1 hypothetical protein [Pseudomonadales bacterium]MBO7004302.1 hypothetical protein [Pseudomonadales bacterium]
MKVDVIKSLFLGNEIRTLSWARIPILTKLSVMVAGFQRYTLRRFVGVVTFIRAFWLSFSGH